MINDQVIKDHRQEMIRRKFPVYQIFDILEQADFSSEDLTLLYKEVSQLTDLVITNGLSVDSELRKTVEDVVRLGMPGAHEIFSAWRTAVDAANNHSRSAAQTMVRDFGVWLSDTNSTTREPYLSMLPRLAPVVAGLGTRGMKEVLQTIDDAHSSEHHQTMTACLDFYAPTYAPIVSGICHIGRSALKWNQIDVLERLKKTVRVEEISENYDAKRVIPALAKLSETCAQQGKDLWYAAVDLILIIAESNLSSAFATAKKLTMCLQKISPTMATPYIEDFRELVRTVGIRVCGFGLKRLPKYYEKYGIEATRAFVEHAASVGMMYGATAGQRFLEKRTTASRKLFEGLQ